MLNFNKTNDNIQGSSKNKKLSSADSKTISDKTLYLSAAETLMVKMGNLTPN